MARKKIRRARRGEGDPYWECRYQRRRKPRAPIDTFKGKVQEDMRALNRKAYSGTYILEAEGTGTVKIGKTSDLRQRVATLRNGLPVRLHLVRFIHGQDHEHRLHKMFAEYRLHGEWFQKSDELVEKLNRYYRSDPYFRPLDA